MTTYRCSWTLSDRNNEHPETVPSLIRPRLNDYYDLPFSQEQVDFAIPLLDDDIPLFVDPFRSEQRTSGDSAEPDPSATQRLLRPALQSGAGRLRDSVAR